MSSKIDWKSKYKELHSKYMNALDVSFRLGFQEGQRQAEMEMLQQQVADMQQQAAAAEEAAMMGEEGQLPPEEGGMPMEGEEGLPMEEMAEEGMEEMPMEEGDELDQSIDELEGFVKKEKFDALKLMKKLHKSEPKSSNEEKSEKQKKIDKMFNE